MRRIQLLLCLVATCAVIGCNRKSTSPMEGTWQCKPIGGLIQEPFPLKITQSGDNIALELWMVGPSELTGQTIGDKALVQGRIGREPEFQLEVLVREKGKSIGLIPIGKGEAKEVACQTVTKDQHEKLIQRSSVMGCTMAMFFTAMRQGRLAMADKPSAKSKKELKNLGEETGKGLSAEMLDQTCATWDLQPEGDRGVALIGSPKGDLAKKCTITIGGLGEDKANPDVFKGDCGGVTKKDFIKNLMAGSRKGQKGDPGPGPGPRGRGMPPGGGGPLGGGRPGDSSAPPFTPPTEPPKPSGE